MFSSLVVKLNNFALKLRKKGFQPEEVLLLFPHCLQCSECSRNILKSLDECQRCGKCKIKDMIELAEKFGVKPFVASGGRLALEEVKKDGVKAVVAVACEKELSEGILHSMPKFVLGLVNKRPHGPCKDTDVEVEKVAQALRDVLGGR